MARKAGTVMTEEQKAAMKVKRDANKAAKLNDNIDSLLISLKLLSSQNLKKVIDKANELIELKKEDEKKAIQAKIEELQKQLEIL